MQVFTSELLQRQSAEVQQSALVEPTFITFHGKPPLVLMSMDAFDRMRNNQRAILNAVEIPLDLRADLEAIAARHLGANEDTGIMGGLLDADPDAATAAKPD
jgi:hypothetical protein